jgi:hypothetical protein
MEPYDMPLVGRRFFAASELDFGGTLRIESY